MSDALTIVGDIHGDIARLEKLLPLIDSPNRKVIFVGDYVDGGPNARAVLELLSGVWRARSDRFVFLMGNHDLAFLDYWSTGRFAPFAAMGGLPTIRSYLPNPHGDVHAALRAALPIHHVEFLRALRPCWESSDVLISHAGYNPEDPTSRALDDMVGGHPSIFAESAPPRRLVVCGHYVQRTAAPHLGDRVICLDTGCGVNQGPLTALRLPERDIVTVF